MRPSAHRCEPVPQGGSALGVEIPLTDRVIGSGGYRLFEIDLPGGREELGESLIVGVRYRF